MSQRGQIFASKVTFGFQHKIEGVDCGVDIFNRERAKGIHHAEAQIVADGKAPAAIRGEAQEQIIEQAVVAIADVDPLGDEEQKTGRVGMRGIESRQSRLGAVQHRFTRCDAAQLKGAVEFLGEILQMRVEAMAAVVIRFGRRPWRNAN
jgi:hypothetical protein